MDIAEAWERVYRLAYDNCADQDDFDALDVVEQYIKDSALGGNEEEG